MLDKIKGMFKKKDKVMVAMATVGSPFILEPMDSHSVLVHYYCYEQEDGKRSFIMKDNGRGLVKPTGILYQMLKNWVKKGTFAMIPFPSYNDIKTGKRKPVILPKRMR